MVKIRAQSKVGTLLRHSVFFVFPFSSNAAKFSIYLELLCINFTNCHLTAYPTAVKKKSDV